MPRVLLVSPFKPYAIDSMYGREDSFPECLHNRVTRAQGIFSYRAFFSVFGLHLIANNISASTRVLEYPTIERFRRELKNNYDYVGIGSVTPNLQKVKLMAEETKKISPNTKIVVGGYCANVDDIRKMMPIDYLCTGEGISFMRELLGDSPDFKFKNPDVFSRAHSVMGVPLFGAKHPHIIPSLGCPYGCEYCSPSHLFGRKYIRLFKTGREIFDEMQRLEKKYKTRVMSFIGDDNFLIDLKRAEELRSLIVESGKQYELFFFASAEKLSEFGPDRLAQMGAYIVWIGRESCFEDNKKNRGINLKELTARLQDHGIKVVLSTMLFMEQHTPENIMTDVEDHLAHQPDFSMFTFFTPLPGTPVYRRYKEEGKLLTGLPYEDWNGLTQPVFHNPLFTSLEAREIRNRVLEREYLDLGPSIMRWIRTDLKAALNLCKSPSAALRNRGEMFASRMSNHRATLWAIIRLAPTAQMKRLAEEILASVESSFGPITPWEKFEGMGLWTFGTKEKIRLRLMGDVIQPPTTVTDYPGRN